MVSKLKVWDRDVRVTEKQDGHIVGKGGVKTGHKAFKSQT